MELQIKDVDYKTTPLDVFTQFHLARKLMPTLIALTKSGEEEELGDIIEPVVMEICRMSDADANYILDSCLSVVFRKDSDVWVKIKPSGTNILQYHDIDLITMLQLSIRVIKENLGDFFVIAPSLMAGLTPE